MADILEDLGFEGWKQKQAPASDVIKFIDDEINYWKKFEDKTLAEPHINRLMDSRGVWEQRVKGVK